MVDALIDDMKSLVDGYRSRDDPAGYFAAMYLGVTQEGNVASLQDDSATRSNSRG